MRIQAVHGRSEAPGGGPQAGLGNDPHGRNSSHALIGYGTMIGDNQRLAVTK